MPETPKLTAKEIARVKDMAGFWVDIQAEIARLQALLPLVSEKKRKIYQDILEKQREVAVPQESPYLANEEWCAQWSAGAQEYLKLLRKAADTIWQTEIDIYDKYRQILKSL